jgi:hypothetical protein
MTHRLPWCRRIARRSLPIFAPTAAPAPLATVDQTEIAAGVRFLKVLEKWLKVEW